MELKMEKNQISTHKDYNIIFQQLINDAIKNGWCPIWIDKIEGDDCFLGAGDIASEWFYFASPEEQKKWGR